MSSSNPQDGEVIGTLLGKPVVVNRDLDTSEEVVLARPHMPWAKGTEIDGAAMWEKIQAARQWSRDALKSFD